jgi:hypothetical protein
MNTIQGWNLSVFDEQDNCVLSNTLSEKIIITHEQSNRTQVWRIVAELCLSQSESRNWSQYIDRIFQREMKFSRLKIETGNNIVCLANAVVCSVNTEIGLNYTTTVCWLAEVPRDNLIQQPRKIKKLFEVQKLDWKTYGF